MIWAKTLEGSVTDLKYWLDFECDVIQDFLANAGKLQKDIMFFQSTLFNVLT